METRMKSGARCAAGVLVALILLSQPAPALEVPVRMSVKFILNGSGNRPATGEFNTDAEVNTQVDRANLIYANRGSEFRHQLLEIVDVSGASQYYLSDTDDRDAIRNAAQADPVTYGWRTDAVNVYVTAANASARADFPPNNNIVIMCQSIFDTTLAHEFGHILNLYHTHSGSETCSDTLPDDPDWTRDGISQNAYGLNYNQLSAGQKLLVDNTWGNLMSYHDGDNRSVLTSCQMDRESAQGYSDRTWLLSKIPVYIDNGAGGTMSGSWNQPFQTVQGAINANALNNRVMVLKAGTHVDPASSIITDTDIITRRGTSYVRDGRPDYDLTYNVEDSTNAAVRSAVVRAQQLDRQGDTNGALAALLEATRSAQGREKDALQLEIGQRLRDQGQFVKAAGYFEKVAQEADQPGLRDRSLKKADKMKQKEQKRLEKLEKKEDKQDNTQEDQ